MQKIKIGYDCDIIDVMERMASILEDYGLILECDNLPHDGFEIYTLREVEDREEEEE